MEEKEEFEELALADAGLRGTCYNHLPTEECKMDMEADLRASLWNPYAMLTRQL